MTSPDARLPPGERSAAALCLSRPHFSCGAAAGQRTPVLVIHGGGEDADMLAKQAESLAAAGFEVITYDRRGTGRSGREDWPGGGADQHADDAAGLLRALGVGPAIVVGVSSGGVIALDLATRHRELVKRVVAWEPPAAGVLPYGDEITAEIMAPVRAHLDDRPDDFVGAQAILLSMLLGFPVAVGDSAFAAARANAAPMTSTSPRSRSSASPQKPYAGCPSRLPSGTRPSSSSPTPPGSSNAGRRAPWSSSTLRTRCI